MRNPITVIEQVLGQPRVVRGQSAGDAVLQALDIISEPRFYPEQVKGWVAALDKLCRDVKG